MDRSDPTDSVLMPSGSAIDSIAEELVRAHVAATLFDEVEPIRRFGRFELRAAIGRGGMGRVYSAWDPVLEREVALKLVDTHRFGPGTAKRALREARSLAKLSHPNIVAVFDAGQAEQRVWIAMELLTGEPMGKWLRREPPPGTPEILQQWLAVARGLQAVHAAGLVHRDVKPSNIVIGDDGRPRLIDFGLVRDPTTTTEPSSVASVEDITDGERQDGSPTRGFVGTRGYAAPEQLALAPVDAMADQYSLCVCIWESLFGERPDAPAGPASPAPLAPAGAKPPARLLRVLQRGLAPSPRDRHPDLAPIVAELERTIERRHRNRLVLLGTAVVSVGATAVTLAALQPGPRDPCPLDETSLAGTWDDARRDALRHRLARSGPGFVEQTTAQIELELDRWAQRWQDARHSSCVATRIDGVQSEASLDLRNDCLDRKRRAVDTLLRTMLDPTLELDVAAHAPELLRELPALEACDDPRRLADVDPLPAPGPQRDAILAAFDDATRIHALARSGRFDDATQRLSALEREAGELGHPPLTIRTEALRGQIDLRRKRLGSALPVLIDAARRAEARRLDELAASLFVDAAEAAIGSWSKPELERWLIDEARVAVERLGRDRDPLTVSLRSLQGRALLAQDRLDEALSELRAARDLAIEVGDEHRASEQEQLIGQALAIQGRLDEADEHYQRQCATLRGRWGATAPGVASCEYNLAILAMQRGDTERAASQLARVREIYTATLGPASLATNEVLFAQAKLAMMRGEFVDALGTIDEILDDYERELGRDHALVAEVHEARGVLRYYTADYPGSIESYEEALRINDALLGPEHHHQARLHSNIGESQIALGHPELALSRFAMALEIYGRALPADHPETALPRKGRGQALLELGRPDEAVLDLERALALLTAQGSEPLEQADTRFALARALRASASAAASTERIQALADQARAAYEDIGATEMVTRIDAWRAEGPGPTE